jgi:hypothetical protein
LSGAGAGVGTIISTYLIGWTADRYSFEPVLIAASLIPLLATIAVVTLVRGRGPGAGSQGARDPRGV